MTASPSEQSRVPSGSAAVPERLIPAAYDLVCLVGCALHGIAPEQARVDAMDPDALFSLSSSLSLNALAAHALDNVPDAALRRDPSWPRWEEGNAHALRRYVLLNTEYGRLRTHLEQMGCWYAPLKGIVLADLYPEPWLRQACDRDVLFDAAFREQVHNWFIAEGYYAEHYKKGVIDQYFKEPLYNFEMHTALIDLILDSLWRTYYADTDTRLIPDGQGLYARHFSHEDFYVYVMLHAHKHHDFSGGTGLRSLVDTYVYLQVYEQDMDWAYIRQELTKLDALDYERRCHGLSKKLFDDPISVSPAMLTDDEQAFLMSFISFGTYGTIENRVRNKLQMLDPDHGSVSARTKFTYIWRRLFPDTVLIEHSYPFFWRHKWLLPVGYIYRLIYKGITNHDGAASELKAARKL